MVDVPRIKPQQVRGTNGEIPTVNLGPGADFRRLPTVKPVGAQAQARAFAAEANASLQNQAVFSSLTDFSIEQVQKQQLLKAESILASKQLEIQNAIKESSLEAPTAAELPAVFSEKSQKILKSITDDKALSPFQRQVMDEKMNNILFSANTKVQGIAFQREQEESLFSLTEIMRSDGILAQNDPSLLPQLIDNASVRVEEFGDALEPTERARILEQYKLMLGENTVLGEIEQEPNLALANLKDNVYDAVLTPEKKSSLLNRAKAASDRVRRIQNEELVSQSKMDLASAIFEGDSLYIPGDKDHESALEQSYEESILGSIRGMDQVEAVDKAQELTGDFINRTGYVPKAVKNTIIANINSNDIAAMAMGAKMMEGLDKITERPRSQFKGNKEVIAKADRIIELSRTMPIARAAELVNESFKPGVKRQKEVLEREARTLIGDKSFAQDLDSAISSTFSNMIGFGEPDLEPATGFRSDAKQDFAALFREFYIANGGDQEAAVNQAQKQIATVYGETKANGTTSFTGAGRVMKHAPELEYPIPKGSDFDSNWIRNQLISDIDTMSDNLFVETSSGLQNLKDIPRDRIVISSDEVTEARAANGVADYQMYVLNDEDIPQPIFEIDESSRTLGPARFAPSVEEELQKEISSKQDKELLRNTNIATINKAYRENDVEALNVYRDIINKFPYKKYLLPQVEKYILDIGVTNADKK